MGYKTLICTQKCIRCSLEGKETLKYLRLYANLHFLWIFEFDKQQIKNLYCDTLYLFPPLALVFVLSGQPNHQTKEMWVHQYAQAIIHLSPTAVTAARNKSNIKLISKHFHILTLGDNRWIFKIMNIQCLNLCTCQLHLTDSDTNLSSKFK